jgi:hypothetical protein
VKFLISFALLDPGGIGYANCEATSPFKMLSLADVRQVERIVSSQHGGVKTVALNVIPLAPED